MKETANRAGVRWAMLLVIVGGISLASSTADAGAQKSERIAMTGIRSFDKVFKKARKTDVRIRDARGSVSDSKAALSKALQLGYSATYAEALKELKNRAKGKIRVVTRGGTPRLEAKEAVPRNIEASIRAVNQLTESIPESIRDLKAASTEARGMMKKAKAFPKNIRSELLSRGVDGWVALVLKSPKISKKVVRNIKLIGKMPGRAAGVTNDMAAITSAVRKTFK